MRTTLNLDDQLLVAAKHRAIEQSVSLAYVIEEKRGQEKRGQTH